VPVRNQLVVDSLYH